MTLDTTAPQLREAIAVLNDQTGLYPTEMRLDRLNQLQRLAQSDDPAATAAADALKVCAFALQVRDLRARFRADSQMPPKTPGSTKKIKQLLVFANLSPDDQQIIVDQSNFDGQATGGSPRFRSVDGFKVNLYVQHLVCSALESAPRPGPTPRADDGPDPTPLAELLHGEDANSDLWTGRALERLAAFYPPGTRVILPSDMKQMFRARPPIED